MTATPRRLSGTIALAFSVLLVGSLPSLSSCAPNTMPAWASATSPNQPASDNELYGVVADSASDVWAVGYYTPTAPGSLSQTLVEHYNGTKWSSVDSADVVGANNYLTGVAALSPSNVWAVGHYDTTTGLTYPLIEHYDGTTWSLVGGAGAAAVGCILSGVAAVPATSALWAVGDCTTTGNIPQLLIEHYDGSGWSLVEDPGPGVLNGVAALSADDVWAVGEYAIAASGPYQTLIRYYNGSGWGLYSGVNGGFNDNYLYGVAPLSANNVWAVGYYGPASGFQQTLIVRYDGSSWSVVTSLNQGVYQNYLLGVAALSADDVWAVGEYATAANGPFQTLIEHYDGHTWSIVASPNSPIEDNHLTGVAVVPGTAHLWAVGYYGHGHTTSPYQTFVMEH
jgi:hypothetical protein